MSKQSNVKVYCRVRPENEKEKQSKTPICIFPMDENTIKICSSSPDQPQDSKTQEFTFDSIFPQNSSQNDIFTKCALPLIKSVLEGINCTLFCYGQTSSGKTYTMEGFDNNKNLQGIIPRTTEYIFEQIPNASKEIEFNIKCNYYQIYNEKIQDLLDTRKTDLSIREDKVNNKGIWVEELTEICVSSEEEMNEVFYTGSHNRTVSATEMNKGSSRSHSLFVITIFQRNTITGSTKTGKIHFVDLAGSEKMSKSGIEKGRLLKEAQNINKSLMTLGMVINALSENAKFVPYRDSKLTRVLQESLGGNSLTTLIVTISPSWLNQNESMSTLRFGQRAKLIKNKVIANTQQSVKELLMKLNKAYDRIKILEEIIDKKGLDEKLNNLNDDEKNNENNKGNKKKVCEDCMKLLTQLSFLNVEYLKMQQDFEDSKRENDNLMEEINEKNRDIFTLNDKIMILQNNIKNLIEEHNKFISEIQNYMGRYSSLNKKILYSIQKNDFKEAKKYTNLAFKKWNECMNELNIENNYLNNSDSNSFDTSSRSCGNMVTNINFLSNSFIQSNVNKSFTLRENNNTTLDLEEKLLKINSVNDITSIELKNKITQLNEIIFNKENQIIGLNKKLDESQEITKLLNEKLCNLDLEFDNYKQKTIKDFSYKENKIIGLINKIAELEDENYKIIHSNKDNMSKKKFIVMEKQIQSFAVEMQKFLTENKKLTRKIREKESKIYLLEKEIKDLKEKKLQEIPEDENFNFENNLKNKINKIDNNDGIYSILNTNRSFTSNFGNESFSIYSFFNNNPNNNKIMKMIKRKKKKRIGTGFFSKMIDNKDNKREAVKQINILNKRSLKENLQEKQFENQMKILENDSLFVDMNEP